MRLSVLGGAALCFLVWASVALAQDPTSDAYSSGDVQAPLGEAGGGAAGGLPFTGFDLALLFGAGLVLVVTGFLALRLARARSEGGGG
jgi:hypothetical protein